MGQKKKKKNQLWTISSTYLSELAIVFRKRYTIHNHYTNPIFRNIILVQYAHTI